MTAEKRNILIEYEVFEWNDDISSGVQELMQSAEQAAVNAYAPYSGFRVGAAILLENGHIITGSNQENAAYPSGLCAERVALFAAASHNPDKKILKISLAAKNKRGETTPITPCGSCRQVMLEYEYKQNQPIKVFLPGPNDTIIQFNSADALLPLGFNQLQLK